MFEKGLHWPIGIFISTVMIIALSVGTVIVALDNPVQLDNTLLKKKYELDKDINIYLTEQISFNKKYNFELIEGQLKSNNSTLKFQFKAKKNININSAFMTLTFTRPNTDLHDFKVNAKFNGKNLFIVNIPNIKLEGRWNIFTVTKINENVGYFNYKADTRKNESFSRPQLILL